MASEAQHIICLLLTLSGFLQEAHPYHWWVVIKRNLFSNNDDEWKTISQTCSSIDTYCRPYTTSHAALQNIIILISVSSYHDLQAVTVKGFCISVCDSFSLVTADLWHDGCQGSSGLHQGDRSTEGKTTVFNVTGGIPVLLSQISLRQE